MMFPISAIIITLGIGTCSTSAEWCNKPTAKMAIEHPIVNIRNHELSLSAEHFSRIGDGELKGEGDRGLEIFMLQYRYRIGE